MNGKSHQELFLLHYEANRIAKGSQPEEVGSYALQALNEIHLGSGPSAAEDRSANVAVMHRFMSSGVGMWNETETSEMYTELRRDAGIE